MIGHGIPPDRKFLAQIAICSPSDRHHGEFIRESKRRMMQPCEFVKKRAEIVRDIVNLFTR
jgi:hypothetical protein